MSFFDALVYTLAYFPVISALARIDNPLPMPTTVHELRGQSYMRHRPSYAGIIHESRRCLHGLGALLLHLAMSVNPMHQCNVEAIRHWSRTFSL